MLPYQWIGGAANAFGSAAGSYLQGAAMANAQRQVASLHDLQNMLAAQTDIRAFRMEAQPTARFRNSRYYDGKASGKRYGG